MRIIPCLLALPVAAAWTEVTWAGMNVAGDVTIPSGTRVTMRGSNVFTGQLTVAAGATLTVDPNANVYLQIGNLEISGTFQIGTAAVPYGNTATIALGCVSGVYPPTDDRRNGINVRTGGAIGTSCIAVAAPVDWVVGDVIVVTTTDYDPTFTERRTITGFGTGGCLKLDQPLVYNHFGEITEGIDERAEVGLLTRNIQFKGCSAMVSAGQRIGGHIKVNPGFASAQVVGVEITAFGQGDIVGRYPIHFHLCGAAPTGTLLRANSVHDTYMRAITIHGTQNVVVERNVAYNVSGHAIFLEDGAEFNNVFDGNLVALVREKLDGPFRLGSDDASGLAGFWITNANNVFRNNVVAGVEGSGFWLHTRLLVKNPSFAAGHYSALTPFTIPLKSCVGNRAHSVWNGFRIDSEDFDGGDVPLVDNGGAFSQAYSPTTVPVITDFTVHHARQGGWFRIFEIVLDNWKLGDVRQGIQFLTTGNTATVPVNGTVRNSLFVGNTANRGNLVATKWQSVAYLEGRSESAFLLTDLIKMALVLYDGPHFVDNCTFANYYSQPCMNYINPAIGARAFNTFMMATTTAVTNCRFVNTAYPVYLLDRQSDGGRTTVIRDTSGSISGYAGAFVLPDWSFYTTARCQRSASYGLACPHRYNNFEIVQIDSDAVNLAKYGQASVARMNLDSSMSSPPSLTFAGQYIPAAGGYLYHPNLAVGATYVVSFLSRTPPVLRFNLVNGNAGDVHTLAVCYPVGTKITSVVTSSGRALSGMQSLRDTSCVNCYFYDTTRAVLVFRIAQTAAPVDITNACPVGGCPGVVITTRLPSGATGVTDAATRAYPLLATTNDAWVRTAFTAVATIKTAGTATVAFNTNWCAFNDQCLNAIDSGNLDTGILAYSNAPCNGIGCYSSTCRYCKLPTSKSTLPFLACPFSTASVVVTTTPVATAEPKAPAVATTAAPRTTTAVPTTLNCKLATGDYQMGLGVYVDAICPTQGGPGCIANSMCRFCVRVPKLLSPPYPACPSGVMITVAQAEVSPDGIALPPMALFATALVSLLVASVALVGAIIHRRGMSSTPPVQAAAPPSLLLPTDVAHV
ncbi:transmembrane protein [Achlya hypogyna]|uniref:Transmembrane protein n=1 Tax=Achlya hypogyna TaxID=1202772 RepID=A0A1V9Z3F6_ACHHY|nr:transmembrane protein [Achlya hypogyna]